MHLVELDPEHPGFADLDYRQRRDAIAQVALDYDGQGPIPDAAYVEAEHESWAEVWRFLAPLHRARVAQELLDVLDSFPIDRARIPQLREVSERLTAATGFRMHPVEGLVPPRRFFVHLADRVFMSTQYVRHPSRPFYTPEPDVIHELVGHAATLAHPGLAELNVLFGQVSAKADKKTMKEVERLYWFTLEFGLVRQEGQLKAVGAGLLSSGGELERATDGVPELASWDLDRVAATEYDTSRYQDVLFVAPSFQTMIDDLGAWLRARA